MRAVWWMAMSAMAGEWSSRPIEPKARPNQTAYTVPQGVFKLGLVDQEVGVLDNVHLGTTAPLFLLAVPNLRGKVTAIQTKPIDVALEGGIYTTSLAPFGVPNGKLTVTPVGLMGSGVLHRRFSVHAGGTWTLAKATGNLGPDEIASGLQQLTGADVSKDLQAALGEGGGLYAGANLTLFQSRLSADYRFNRRDSLILTSNTYVWLSGLLAAGVGVEATGGAEVNVGASARLKLPLKESLPSLTTLSWQFDWPKVNLRLGIPLPLDNVFAYFQAVDLYVLLGKRPSAVVSPVTPVTDTDATPPAVDSGAPQKDSGADTGVPEVPQDTG